VLGFHEDFCNLDVLVTPNSENRTLKEILAA